MSAWLKLVGNSALGGARFFAQMLVLRYPTPTNLSCANVFNQATLIYLSIWLSEHDLLPKVRLNALLFAGTLVTISVSALYTYVKTSRVLCKRAECVTCGAAFERCLTGKPPALASQQYSSSA